MRARGQIIIYFMYHSKWQLDFFFLEMKVFASHKYLEIAMNLKLIGWIERKINECCRDDKS